MSADNPETSSDPMTTVETGPGHDEASPSARRGPTFAETRAALQRLIPFDHSGHVTACSYDESGHCGCFTLPARWAEEIRQWAEAWVREDRAQTLRAAAQAIQSLHPGETKASVVFLQDRANRIAHDLTPEERLLRAIFGTARACRNCGCTDDNACIVPGKGPCWWVEADLCAACTPADGEAGR